MKTFTILLILCGVALTIAPTATDTINATTPNKLAELNTRRLGLPKSVKSILKGAANFFAEMLIDCLFSYATEKLPNNPFWKFIEKGAEQVKEEVKAVIAKTIGGLIDKLRRIRRMRLRRRRMGWFSNPFKSIGKAIGKAAKSVGKAVKKVAKKVGKGIGKAAVVVGKGVAKGTVETGKGIGKAAVVVGKGIETAVVETGKGIGKAAVETGKGIETAVVETGKGIKKAAVFVAKSALDVVKYIAGLPGKLLLIALIKVACPYITKKISEGLSSKLKDMGFVMGIPPCVEESIGKACVQLVRKAMGRQRLLRRLGYVRAAF